MMNAAEMSLRVPGKQEYAMVLRTALGGVAVIKDLNVDMLDDLRMATDEAFACLTQQGRVVNHLVLSVFDRGHQLTVQLEAEFAGDTCVPCEDMTAISQAVLETLIPQVELRTCECGCIQSICLTLNKAV